MAHAFYPGSGRGGDVHFDQEELWYYDHDDPKPGGANFFSVAVHELGHSLGLGHSSVEGSLMFPWYRSSVVTDLSEDDKNGIKQIYKSGEKEWGPINPPRRTTHHHHHHTTSRPRFEEQTTRAPEYTTRRPPPPPRESPTRAPMRPTQKPTEPNTCNTHYDAIAMIRGELYIFSGKYMWRFSIDGRRMVETTSFWKGLPENYKKIDSVYENNKGEIMFFIGSTYFVFRSNIVSYSAPLTHLGLPSTLNNIDAMFKWGHNNKTFIFSGTKYWRYVCLKFKISIEKNQKKYFQSYRFDEEEGRVEKDYPREIARAWRGVNKIDTVFQWSDGKKKLAIDIHINFN